MFTFKNLINIILLITTPTFFLHSGDRSTKENFQILQVKHSKQKNRKNATNSQIVSYDDILHLLEELESGRLEKRASLEDLGRVNQFLISLARQGVVPYNADCLAQEEDIGHLLYGEDEIYEFAFSPEDDQEYSIIPAILNKQHDTAKISEFLE
ncbi:MAG: hypothetical protein JSS30_05265 [Verrucomicrobia bacterium]|nr:hypothetical protein [Verrucomicrobiota bacterium]